MPNPKARLREQVPEMTRFKHYARRTKESAGWGGGSFKFEDEESRSQRHPGAETGIQALRDFVRFERALGAQANTFCGLHVTLGVSSVIPPGGDPMKWRGRVRSHQR